MSVRRQGVSGFQWRNHMDSSFDISDHARNVHQELHLFEGFAVQGVGHDMADGDAAAAKALDVARNLIALVQVHENDLGPAWQLIVAAVQVSEQLQHEGCVLPPADQHRLWGTPPGFPSAR